MSYMTFFTLGVDLQGRSAVAVGAGEQGVFGAQSELAAEGLQSAGLPVPSTCKMDTCQPSQILLKCFWGIEFLC